MLRRPTGLTCTYGLAFEVRSKLFSLSHIPWTPKDQRVDNIGYETLNIKYNKGVNPKFKTYFSRNLLATSTEFENNFKLLLEFYFPDRLEVFFVYKLFLVVIS